MYSNLRVFDLHVQPIYGVGAVGFANAEVFGHVSQSWVFKATRGLVWYRSNHRYHTIPPDRSAPDTHCQ